MELPESMNPLPQLLEYHFHEAPVPKEPPEMLNVVELPGHILLKLADIIVGGVELV